MFHRASSLAVLLFAGLVSAPPLHAAPETERDCIKKYITARSNPKKSLEVLRECAARFPDSAVIQLTLGRRLLRDYDEGTLDSSVRSEALAALERAAELDPAQVGEDWLKIAHLHDEAGRPDRCLHALGEAEPFLARTKREEVQDRRWDLALELDDHETALAVWDSIRFRRANDCDAQITAGRLLLGAGRPEQARRAFERALELRPGEPEAAAPLCHMLTGAVDGMTGSDRKLMLDTCEPLLDRLEADELEVLIDAALRVFRTEQALSLAEVALERDADNATAHFVLAEQGLRELMEDRKWSDADEPLLVHARKSLRGNLPEDREARAHAILGTALTYRALARYRSGGGGASSKLLTSTRQAFREALGHLGRAQSGGEPVSGEIEEVREALRALGVMDVELEKQELQARIAECESLGRQARQGYERNRPLKKSATRSTGLAPTVDSPEELARLESGRPVILLDARWGGDECRCRVKLEDGTTGWAPMKALD